jgi:hypothetical protein
MIPRDDIPPPCQDGANGNFTFQCPRMCLFQGDLHTFFIDEHVFNDFFYRLQSGPYHAYSLLRRTPAMIMKSVSLQTPVVDVKDRDGSRILLFLINLQCDYSIGPKRFKDKVAGKSLFANPLYSL